MAARTKRSDNVAKITKKHFATFAGAILAFFTLINFHAMSMTSCGGIDAGNPPTNIMNSKVPLSLSAPSEKSASGTLESTLLFLFESIRPPHWKDTDVKEQHLNMKTMTNVFQRSEFVDKEDITLVTHGSIDKFPRILDQVEQWQGPISFTVYLDQDERIRRFCRLLQEDATPAFRKYVSVHVLLERHGGSLPYPNNVLRNAAQRNIESNYFFLMDVDFITSPGLYQYLKTSLEEMDNKEPGNFYSKLRNNTVFVIPAFERFPNDGQELATADMVPQSKQELASMIDQKHASTFHAYYCPGHSPTNFSEWFREPSPLLENKEDKFAYPIQYMNKFEPYIVAFKRGLPDFYDGFRGFGYNAATWFWEVHLAGYKFEVIRNQFVVHLNHPGRKERNLEESDLPRAQLRRFMRYVSRKYHLGQYDVRRWKRGRNFEGDRLNLSCE